MKSSRKSKGYHQPSGAENIDESNRSLVDDRVEESSGSDIAEPSSHPASRQRSSKSKAVKHSFRKERWSPYDQGQPSQHDEDDSEESDEFDNPEAGPSHPDDAQEIFLGGGRKKKRAVEFGINTRSGSWWRSLDWKWWVFIGLLVLGGGVIAGIMISILFGSSSFMNPNKPAPNQNAYNQDPMFVKSFLCQQCQDLYFDDPITPHQFQIKDSIGLPKERCEWKTDRTDYALHCDSNMYKVIFETVPRPDSDVKGIQLNQEDNVIMQLKRGNPRFPGNRLPKNNTFWGKLRPKSERFPLQMDFHFPMGKDTVNLRITFDSPSSNYVLKKRAACTFNGTGEPPVLLTMNNGHSRHSVEPENLLREISTTFSLIYSRTVLRIPRITHVIMLMPDTFKNNQVVLGPLIELFRSLLACLDVELIWNPDPSKPIDFCGIQAVHGPQDGTIRSWFYTPDSVSGWKRLLQAFYQIKGVYQCLSARQANKIIILNRPQGDFDFEHVEPMSLAVSYEFPDHAVEIVNLTLKESIMDLVPKLCGAKVILTTQGSHQWLFALIPSEIGLLDVASYPHFRFDFFPLHYSMLRDHGTWLYEFPPEEARMDQVQFYFSPENDSAIMNGIQAFL